MGIRSNVTGSQFAVFQRKAQAKYDERIEDVTDIIEEVMTDAATEMRHYISDRGVRNTVPNQEGRGTGAMEQEVDHRVTNRDGVVHGRFGFIRRTSAERRAVLGWQEDGTLNKGQPSGDPKPAGSPPRGIRPMLALADAEAHADEELTRRLPGRRRRK